MNRLLNAIALAARADEADWGRVPDDLVPRLSDRERDELTDLILSAQLRAQLATASTRTTAGESSHPRPVSPSRRRVVAIAGSSALFAAVALAFWLRPSGRLPAVPAYSLSTSGEMAELRDAVPETGVGENASGLKRIGPNSELRIECRPAVPTVGPVAARVLFMQNRESTEIPAVIRLAPTGAADVRIRGADLVGHYRGRGDLQVLIGRPEAILGKRLDGSDELRILTIHIDLLPL